METNKGIFYAQSGGPTSVINATACAVIKRARQMSSKLYIGKNGILGGLKEELIDADNLLSSDLLNLDNTPGSVFGSCRYKMPSLDDDLFPYKRLVDVFKAHNIGFFLYNGGGDSQDTAHRVAIASEKIGYKINCIGIPKTIDNDLDITYCSPGFGSVAKYVAISVQEATLDIKSMCNSSTKVFILEVMGRHTGWIAASSVIGRPHVILIPEIKFNESIFLEKVRKTILKNDYCVIVASEGIKYANGEFVSAGGVVDAFGHKQLGGVGSKLADLITSKTGYKCHFAIADYLQRSARHISSLVDLEHARLVGRAAVDAALKLNKNKVMITINRAIDPGHAEYRWETGFTSLSNVANVEKMLPIEYIGDDGLGIKSSFMDYAVPLILGEAYPQYKNGMPVYSELNHKLIEKKLPAFK